ncbi:MAG: sugar phosphate isomerase/epimerase [Planctomycetes bacterium]|nr:sugar phosphate isomerase/epimerase [Planctomycetota bacterium]
MPKRQLAVCSWSLRPKDPGELLARLRLAGMDRVQLALVPLVAQPDLWGGAIELLRGEGIEIESGMLAMIGEDYSSIARIRETGGVRCDQHWSANRERAGLVADLARKHGIALVTFHAGFLPEDTGDPLRAVMLERLREIIDLFAKHGVQVAFESGQEKSATLERALEDLQRPETGVNFDPANMLLYGLEDPLPAFRRLRERVRQVHAKDAIASGQSEVWGRETAVGAGQVPWKLFMELVAALPREVAVVIEREGGERRVEEIAAAKKFLEPMLS